MTDHIRRCYRAADHRAARRRRRQPSAGGAGRARWRCGPAATPSMRRSRRALALGVVEPMMSGLGGDGFYHVFDARRPARAVVFNGTGPAPRAATPERYAGGIPRTGPLSVSVPGMLAGLGAMHARVRPAALGATCSPRRSALPATASAPRRIYRHFAGEHLATAARRQAQRRGLSARRRRAAGRRADRAARPGPHAGGNRRRRRRDASIAAPSRAGSRAACAEAGALVAEADLAEFEAEEQAADRRSTIAASRSSRRRRTRPASCCSQELKIVENFDLAAMGLGSADLVHVLVEAKKLAFADRERWGADPRTVERAARRAAVGRLCRPARRPHRHAAAPRRPARIADAAGDTTYFCIADGDGNAVSGIQSINSGWGSGVTAGDTGILLNNRMAYWHLEPGHPNRLRPGPARAPHDEPAAGAQGRQSCGASSARPAPTTRCRSTSRC